MFSIYDGRESFYQWDLNQKLIVYDDSITEVHFCNKTDDCALVCEVYKDGSLSLVNVPNVLLQDNWTIRVYAVAADHTEHEARYKVHSRSKPADYIYTETEVKTFDALEQRVAYLEENGVETEVKAQIEANKADIATLKMQVPGFATKDEVARLAGTVKANMDEMAQELEDYALKAEIPEVPSNISAFNNDAGYQTAAQVSSIVKAELEVVENGTY